VSAAQSCAELAIRAVADDVRPASDWLAQSCEAHGVPDTQILRLDLCLNEALANVIAHGGEQALANPVRLRLNVTCDGLTHQAIVTVCDSGPPFDTTSVQPGALPLTLDDAEPGGLGLLMIRNLSDSLSYWYDEGHNELAFGVHWADEAG
jgi:anti-sigma regulatory factor (Ser/Thr protein kinase)